MKVHVHGYGIGQVIEVLQQLDNQFSNTFCCFFFKYTLFNLIKTIKKKIQKFTFFTLVVPVQQDVCTQLNDLWIIAVQLQIQKTKILNHPEQ